MSNVRISYDATGRKLRYDNTDYAGPFVYESGVLRYIITTEGRAIPNGSSYQYEYHIKDHLGNVRVAFMGNNEVPAVIQKNDYYPFGLLMQERTDNASNKNKYLYNGKEFLPDNDLSWYDYGARMYDPQLGRFHCIDPRGEEFLNITPYVYVANNPILFIDPTGEFIRIYYDDDGNFIDYDPNVDYNEKDEQGNYKYNQFVRDIAAQLSYLIENAQDPEKIVETLVNAKDFRVDLNSANIEEEGKMTFGLPFAWYTGSTGIFVDPRGGIVTTEGGLESGIAGMIHELGHAYNDYQMYKEVQSLIKKGMDPNDAVRLVQNREMNEIQDLPDWQTSEEKYIIQNFENPMMEHMKQATRNNHSGKFYKTAGPLTTEPANDYWKEQVRSIIKKYTGN